MTLETWADYFWTLSVIAAAATLWRLRRERMLSLFRMLGAFLAWEVGIYASLRFVRLGTDRYAYIWFADRVITWVVSVLVALELVTLITRHYPGIATLARWCIRGALGIGIAVALLSATIDLSHSTAHPEVFYSTFQLVDRTVSVSVVCFIVASVLFLLWFPIRLSRNVVAYALAFVVMYSVRVGVLLFMNARGTKVAPLVSTLEMLVTFGAYAYWFFALRHARESERVVVGHAWNRTRENRLIHQLKSINATVLRATKQSEP